MAAELTARERSIRRNVRNFLMVATPSELAQEKRISISQGDLLRARFVQELIDDGSTLRTEEPLL